MIYFAPETLDRLAEEILIAAASARDAQGRRIGRAIETAQAPESTRLALNGMFGKENWATLSEWPRPEQLRPLILESGESLEAFRRHDYDS